MDNVWIKFEWTGVFERMLARLQPDVFRAELGGIEISEAQRKLYVLGNSLISRQIQWSARAIGKTDTQQRDPGQIRPKKGPKLIICSPQDGGPPHRNGVFFLVQK